MTKRRLSEQFREQLGSLGDSLAKHTRTLEVHFESQEEFLLQRQADLEEDQKKLLSATPEEDSELQRILAPFLRGDFAVMTVAELRKLCTSKGIKKVSKLKRDQLLRLIEENKLDPPSLPAEKIIKKLKRSQLEEIATYFVASAL